MKEKKTVVVGMSGGVDSSLCAALLKQQGYEVVGVMMKLWSELGCESQNNCCTPEAVLSAQKVAFHIDIPFHVIDEGDFFYDKIVTHFISSYIKGKTPNPCVRCNSIVRWESLLEFADSIDAEFIATGHFAIVEKTEKKVFLKKALDRKKDQSYMLSFLNKEQLRRTIFPLGLLTKEEVRAIAEQLDIPTAHKKDSQDLCFLGNSNYRDFLLKYATKVSKQGNIVTLENEVIGKHQGLAFYTIGQRKGLTTSKNVPLYVVDKNFSKNELIVAEKNHSLKTIVFLEDISLINELNEDIIFCQAKIRYTAPLVDCQIEFDKKEAVVRLKEGVMDCAPGQVLVFYSNDICLGGGIIKSCR